MRMMLAAMLCSSILMALPATAAPLAPKAGSETGAAVVPVAGGCGPGFHHRHWRDHWGRWHWGACIRNHW